VRQSGAFLGFLKRVSTSEHGIAGHDRLALSVRSWSSCSIAAMRRLKSIRSTSMTLARRHRRGPGEPVSGLPPNGGFGRSLEDVSYGPYVKEPSRQVHVVATKSSTGNPGSRPSDPRKPRRLGASSSLPARCGESAVGSEHQVAHYPYSLHINYMPQLVFRQKPQAVLGQNRSRNILHALDLHLHPITSKNVLSR
jgi:hypothetical protein